MPLPRGLLRKSPSQLLILREMSLHTTHKALAQRHIRSHLPTLTGQTVPLNAYERLYCSDGKQM